MFGELLKVRADLSSWPETRNGFTLVHTTAVDKTAVEQNRNGRSWRDNRCERYLPTVSGICRHGLSLGHPSPTAWEADHPRFMIHAISVICNRTSSIFSRTRLFLKSVIADGTIQLMGLCYVQRKLPHFQSANQWDRSLDFRCCFPKLHV